MAISKKDRIRAEKRALRTRSKLKKGTTEKPRISVFKSAKHIYAQIIDDSVGLTLASSSSLVIADKKGDKKNIAYTVGLNLAEHAKQKGIAIAFFDRGKNLYIGRIKALADGIREGGIHF